MTMLPTTIEFYEELETILEEEIPTKTYKIDLKRKRVIGTVDGQEAMQQAIFKILQTERYWFSKVYTEHYGSEILNLIGQLPDIISAKLPMRIKDALLSDERILNVKDFEVKTEGSDFLVSFIANTVFGDVEINDYVVEV